LISSYGKHGLAEVSTDNPVPGNGAGTVHVPMLGGHAHGLAVGTAGMLAVLLLAALAHHWRKQYTAARMRERQRIRRYERESIARSLHDTYLQSVQGLMFSTHAALRRLPADGDVRNDFEALLLRMGRVLTEGRDQLNVLRCAFISSHDFWASLLRDLDLIAPGAGERVRSHGLDAIDRVCRQLQHDLYAIAREAVTNALHHTNGTVTVHASASARAFVLSIVDEGGGYGEFIGGKPGHYGLQGMRERSVLLGATLELADVTGGGARVTLTLSARLAYRSQGLDTGPVALV
jgi:nitrate/nitrite-specific signal transduction histidine kinase